MRCSRACRTAHPISRRQPSTIIISIQSPAKADGRRSLRRLRPHAPQNEGSPTTPKKNFPDTTYAGKPAGAGVVLEPDADRTPRPAALAHTSRAGERHLRLPRDLPQSSATALRAWHDHTNRVRSSKSTNHSGMRIQNLAYAEPGTPQSLRLPGEVQFGERGR